MSDIDAEAVKPEPRRSWQGHTRTISADVGDETTVFSSNHSAFHW